MVGLLFEIRFLREMGVPGDKEAPKEKSASNSQISYAEALVGEKNGSFKDEAIQKFTKKVKDQNSCSNGKMRSQGVPATKGFLKHYWVRQESVELEWDSVMVISMIYAP